jgi:hypothetical protein
VASGVGAARCSDPDTVTVTNGLFNMNVDGCTDSDINGDQLYLGITVGSDSEMTPRQAIYAVPYARSLRPGADIVGSSGSNILYVENTSTGYAVHLKSTNIAAYLEGDIHQTQ